MAFLPPRTLAQSFSSKVPVRRRRVQASAATRRAVTEVLEARTLMSFGGPQDYPIGPANVGSPYAVATGDFNGDGKLDVITSNASGGVSVLLNAGGGSLLPARTSTFGNTIAWGVAAGDFNGDGKLDAVIVNSTVSVMLGKGDGTLGAPGVLLNTGGSLRAVAVGDLNGDGKLDIAAVDEGFAERRSFNHVVDVFYGNGNGTFGGWQQVSVGNGPDSIVLADMNRDGKLDVVTSNYADGTVSEVLGNGNGTYQGVRNFGVGTHPVSVAVGDFNGDRNPDIAAGMAGGKEIVITGKGDGSFNGGKNFDSSTSVNSIAAADFNGDGKLDLVAANNQADTISVFLGNGNATFAPAVNYGTGDQPWAVAAADLSGDGRADIVTANVSGGDVSVFLSSGTGAMVAPPTYAVGAQPADVQTADFNGDGNADLVTADSYGGTVSVLLGNGNGSFQPAITSATGGGVNGAPGESSKIAVGDFNGDGRLDLAVSNWAYSSVSNGSVSILLGNGDGTFQAPSVYAAGVDPYGITAADLNGDGILDLAVADNDFNNAGPAVAGQSTVSVLLGNGDGTFAAGGSFETGGAHPVNVVAADFNGDGRADLAVTSTSYNGPTNALTLLAGNGDGTFAMPVVLVGGTTGNALAAADLNADGKLDLVATTGLGTVVVAGNGDGSFAASAVIASVGWSGLAVGDVNGDGKLDVVAGNGFTASVIMNNGDGTFATPRNYLLGAPVNALVLGDFNHDGLLDLAVADSVFGSPGNVAVFLNN